MSANHDLERRIADHYAAEAPLRSPDWVLEQILASVDSTPQRRTVFGRPWRIPTMTSTFAKLGVASVAIAAVGLVGLTLLRQPAVGPAASSQSPSTSARPLFRPGEATFTSTIHGISVDYPAGWQTKPATEPWAGVDLAFDSPAADVIFDPALGDRVYLLISSRRYDNVGKEEWWNEATLWLCPEGGHGFGRLTVEGLDGRVVQCGSREAVFVYTKTRGYVIRLIVSGDPQLTETYDWDWFNSVLETVDLRPDEAAGAPNPSPSP